MTELFLTFAKIGVMTFGGGVAMLPMLQREIVDKHHWASEEEMLDYYAIGQCTPGIIAVNCATFIGYKQKKTAGAVAATFGVVFPSLVIILLLAGLITNYSGIPAVNSAFAGIRVCVCVLVLNAVVKLAKKSVIDAPTAAIMIVTAVCSLLLQLSPIFYVLVSAAVGILLKSFGGKHTEENGGGGKE